MLTNEVRAILDDIKIFDRTFKLTPVETNESMMQSPYHKQYGWHMQVCYDEADIETGKIETGKIERQESRRWFLSAQMTESEIVDTAFAAVMRSYDHVVQEHFTYKGKRVFSPHFTIDVRMRMADEHQD